MAKKIQRKPLKTPLKGSKKKQRTAAPAIPSQDSQESKWQEFLRRHSGSTEKKG